MINVIQCLVKTSKSTVECFCELIFTKINSNSTYSKISQIEYVDDLSFEKFREYYSIYCYALDCNEEVLEPSLELNKILEKYMYVIDGNFIRAFSASSKYKVYRGLMEYLFYVVNISPKKNYDALLD